VIFYSTDQVKRMNPETVASLLNYQTGLVLNYSSFVNSLATNASEITTNQQLQDTIQQFLVQLVVEDIDQESVV